jgi:serine phosphatase RsbU (regulator of sigma subunit)
LYFHEKWKIINDSLKDEEEKRSITTKALNYEFNKRAMADSVAAAELRQRDKLKHENEIAVQRTYTYAGVFGLVLMMVITVMAIKAYRQKKNDNLIISQQKQIVEEHQKEILDSIHYAKRIQSAILAKPEEIKVYFPESFLIYKPKDIVAGDFYFFETTATHLFYAAADCTGHGVPGALVSVVCSNALNRCVKEFGLINPGEILTKARELVLDTFKKSGQEVKDGMDISFVSINKKEIQKGNGVKVEWAGAFNPLWYSSGKEMKVCKANKQPIGLNESPEPFTTHTLNLEKGNVFYLFTDGYADQFGGPKGKKFKYKKLEELLLSINHLPVNEQSDIIIKEFEAWRGELEQVDDVCVIGVKV